MKIVFYPSLCLPFHGKTLSERPLGGTETGVIRLAEALCALGHEVIVISQYAKPPLTEPLYLPESAARDLGPFDVLVAVRDWRPLLSPLQCSHRFFWTGDSYDQPQNIGIGDKRIIERLEGFFCVSEWQADTISEKSGFPREKCHVIRNGIHPPHFEGQEERRRKRLIYSSTPYRGLAHTPHLYKELLKRHSNGLEFQIFSGYSVYAGVDGKYNELLEAEFEQLSRELSSLPGCTVKGNVTQQELAREFMRASILFYPNTFEETSCITAMEAQAAGCATVTSNRGALPETVSKAGILIDGEPGSDLYSRTFIDAVDSLLTDDRLFGEYSRQAQIQAKEHSWTHVAERVIASISEKN